MTYRRECGLTVLSILSILTCFITFQLCYVGRPVLPTPAVGIGVVHQQQAKQVIEEPFAAHK